MNANVLFGMALGLGSGWEVVKSEMDVEGSHLRLWLDFKAGSLFACPKCGEWCPVHDTVEKKWRHLNFWQHETTLIARVPRTGCEEDGVLSVEVPWARSGSGFTLMMEAMILLLCQQMPVSDAAKQLGEHDTRLWRILDHYVSEAHKAKDWSSITRIMVDETSAQRGRRYVTNVLDGDTKELLLMVEGRSANAIKTFALEMAKHGANPVQITEVIMDMSAAYISGTRAVFPQARIVFDHFHIMKLAGEALDRVRLDLRARGADLAGGLWALRGNEWTRTEKQLELRNKHCKTYPQLGRAMALRECLQDVLSGNDPASLKWWINWAAHSRLEAFKKLGRTLKEHFDGVLAFMETRLTNASMEAINGVLQLAKRAARGFRNIKYFRLAAYLKIGGLNIKVPQILPT